MLLTKEEILRVQRTRMSVYFPPEAISLSSDNAGHAYSIEIGKECNSTFYFNEMHEFITCQTENEADAKKVWASYSTDFEKHLEYACSVWSYIDDINRDLMTASNELLAEKKRFMGYMKGVPSYCFERLDPDQKYVTDCLNQVDCLTGLLFDNIKTYYSAGSNLTALFRETKFWKTLCKYEQTLVSHFMSVIREENNPAVIVSPTGRFGDSNWRFSSACRNMQSLAEPILNDILIYREFIYAVLGCMYCREAEFRSNVFGPQPQSEQGIPGYEDLMETVRIFLECSACSCRLLETLIGQLSVLHKLECLKRVEETIFGDDRKS